VKRTLSDAVTDGVTDGVRFPQDSGGCIQEPADQKNPNGQVNHSLTGRQQLVNLGMELALKLGSHSSPFYHFLSLAWKELIG
jgi:hypothetical protein